MSAQEMAAKAGKAVGSLLRVFLTALDDMLILAGCALILIGVYQVWPLATWFVAGGMLIAFGVMIGVGNAHK